MKTILISIPVKNTGKYLPNLFEQITQLSYDLTNITIVLVEGDSEDDSYQVCLNMKAAYPRINVIVDQLRLGYSLEHSSVRYHVDKFPQRIKNLVITRNYIIDNYRKDHDFVWWIDSDFNIIPQDTITKFIACDKDIVIPILTHPTYGYHDCGSVIFMDDVQVRFQTVISTEPLIKLDRSDTHCFIKSHVFDRLRYEFIEQPYFDGCGSRQNCWSDGTSFSLNAVKLGYQLYGAQHIIIQHHDV
jgi:glycosyltransferase involved in cell wall biosynthesis